MTELKKIKSIWEKIDNGLEGIEQPTQNNVRTHFERLEEGKQHLKKLKEVEDEVNDS